ncbi:MAG TPA: hypothetical protein DDZ51_06285 [Planctomycetaceae bacterium]|nr:hypothetical protein [Planctomycetaceae bacterium]
MRRSSAPPAGNSAHQVTAAVIGRWMRKLRRTSASGSKAKRSRLHRHRLAMEVLESRRVLATYIVDTTADTASGICGIDGIGNIGCSLRSAIIAANNNPNADIIRVPAGTYNLTIANDILADQTEGSLDILDPVSIIGMTGVPSDVIIDGQNLDSVFNVQGNGVFIVDVRLESLTIQNGLTIEEGGGVRASFANLEVVNSVLQNNRVLDPSFAFAGGAIFADDASLLLDRAVIRNNSVSDSGVGGGVAFYSRIGYVTSNQTAGGGSIVIVDTRFEGNSGQVGGGLFIEGTDPNGARAVLDSVVFDQNTASDKGGGAHIEGMRFVTITDGEFTLNDAGGGGGGINLLPEQAITSNSLVTITGTSFRDNRARLSTAFIGDGGAIFADRGVRMEIRGADFLRNSLGSSSSSGGAIRSNHELLIEDSEFRNNSVAAGSGGGVSFNGSATDSLTISRTIFANNSASNVGGGLDALGDFGAPVILEDVTFDQNIAVQAGGGAYLYLVGPVDITDSRFLRNTTDEAGGGLYLLDAGAALISQTVFDGNIANGGGGGGVAILTDTAIEDSLFQNNVVTTVAFAFDEGGGGISIAQDAGFFPTVSIVRTSIVDNRAPLGGGIGSANANLTITDSTIARNNATNNFGGGGGIGFAQDDTLGSLPRVRLTVTDSVIRDNISAVDAGGIGVADADASIRRTTVASNIAGGRGGGIGIIGSNNSPSLTIEDSTIARNTAGADGGGIAAVNAGLQTNNVTISNNAADGVGGGLAYSNINDTLEGVIGFTTIASNSTLSGAGSNVASNALPVSFLYSLIADPIGVNASGTNFLAGPGSVVSAFFNLDSDGSGGLNLLGDQSNVDPRIGPLADNGGPVQTHALLPGSPAIDASDTFPFPTDARGFPRLQDGNADGEDRNDIGAFEASTLTIEANDDTATVGVGQAVLIAVLENDTTNNPPLRIVSVFQPTNGSVSISGNQILYVANDTFTGIDLFTYTITNSPLGTDTPNQTALVTVTVDEINRTPTAISLTDISIPSDSPTGTAVGTFTTTDPDIGDTHTYTLVAGVDDDDNSDFSIVGDSLLAVSVFDFETQSSYRIRVRSTDSGGLFIDQVFDITIDPVLRFKPDSQRIAEPGVAEVIDGATLTANDIAGAQSPTGIVSIASVTPTTGQGGSVTLVGQQITYTSPVGFSGIDTVEYVIADGFGITNATLQVNVVDNSLLEADLATSTLRNQAQVAVNDLFSYTIFVDNLSLATATNVVVVTTIGSLAFIDGFSASMGTVVIDSFSNTATWTLPSIPPLTTFSYTLGATAGSQGVLVTTSNASSSEIDPNLLNNLSTDTVTIASSLGVELHTLSTGNEDGDIQIDVDAFGIFGTAAFSGADPIPLADFDPVGPLGSMDVVARSILGFRPQGRLEFSPLVRNAPGVVITQQIDGTLASATSAFTVGELSVALDQSVAATFHPDGSRAGAQLRQVYTVFNASNGPLSFDLARFLDADLIFESSFGADGGGVLIDSNGRLIAFITDNDGTASTNTPFVAMTTSGGDSLTSDRFDIDRESLLESRLFDPTVATSLRNAVSGDINADGFVDSGQGYDSAAALRNAFTLSPGQSIVYLTDTIFGTRPDSLLPPAVSGDLTGHVFCDINGNGIEDLGEAAAGALVFVDLNENRIFDSVLGEPHAFADLQGNYSIFFDNLPPGQRANVVVVNPPGCFPNVPEIGVTRSSLTTGMLSRDIATIFNPQTGLDELLVINELGNDLVRLRQAGSGGGIGVGGGPAFEIGGIASTFSISSTTSLGKRPYALSVYQPSGQLPTIAVAAIGTGAADPGLLYVIDDSGVREFSAGDGPIAVVVDDFNGDGQPDFITASFRDGKILARLSGVDEPIEIAQGLVPRSISKADINGDSHLDLVVVTTGFRGDSGSEVIILLGDGEGGFSPLRGSISRGEAIDVVVGDFDGSGSDQLVIANFSGTIEIFKVDPVTGALQQMTSLMVGAGVTAVAAEDINGDGRLDLVTVNPRAETIEIFIGQADRPFMQNRTISGVVTPGALAIGRFDSDPILDIAVTNLFSTSNPYRLPSTVTILGLTVTEREVMLSQTQRTTADFGFMQFGSTPLPRLTPSEFRHDINRDGAIAPLDALLVLNEIGGPNSGIGEGETVRRVGPRYKFDVNGDGVVTPLDALLILNRIASDQQALLLATAVMDDDDNRISAIDQVMAEAMLF